MACKWWHEKCQEPSASNFSNLSSSILSQSNTRQRGQTYVTCWRLIKGLVNKEGRGERGSGWNGGGNPINCITTDCRQIADGFEIRSHSSNLTNCTKWRNGFLVLSAISIPAATSRGDWFFFFSSSPNVRIQGFVSSLWLMIPWLFPSFSVAFVKPSELTVVAVPCGNEFHRPLMHSVFSVSNDLK